FAHLTLRTKAVVYAIAALWWVALVAIAALGGFAQGAIGPVPGPVVAFAVLVIGGLVAWFAWSEFHRKLLSIPLAALLGVNITRCCGDGHAAVGCRADVSRPTLLVDTPDDRRTASRDRHTTRHARRHAPRGPPGGRLIG